MKKDKVIELRNVEVTYKERRGLFRHEKYTALKNISFDVFKGETLGVIGRNGAGKSTLLRILAGIIKPDAGSIRLHTKSVSLMALQAGFDPNLSGRQNTIISGMLLGHRLSHVKSLIDDIKKYSELNDFFEKPIKNYSSGMLARLGFSIAMFTTPEVLLIDEVLGVGDITFAEKAQRSIKEKIKSDTTVVVVSHDEAQLRQLSDRLVCIENGVVIAEGDTDSVYIKYNMMMKLTSYGLSFKSYENKNTNVSIKDINVSVEYADIEFYISDFNKVGFMTEKTSYEIADSTEGIFWLRVYYSEVYSVKVFYDDNVYNSFDFRIVEI